MGEGGLLGPDEPDREAFSVGRRAPDAGESQPRSARPRRGVSGGGERVRGAGHDRDAWEWTASDLAPYPGFEPFPYKEYSEVFFGSDYKVLRGGSRATRPSAIRTTFRNWDFPVRRQLFVGFRCAK